MPILALLISAWTTAMMPAAGHFTGELQLKPGVFALISSAELGAPVDFENEIDTHVCFPLRLAGRLVTWIHRAYALDDQLFVQRCQEFDPRVQQTPGNRHGGVDESWDEVRTSQVPRALEFMRVEIPDWYFASNPSFCRQYLAYWAMRGGNLAASVYDLTLRRRTAVRSLGGFALETDDAYFLPAPGWSKGCTQVNFDARPVGKGTITLRPKP